MTFPVLVPLIGLPGVGKSTFASSLKYFLQNEGNVAFNRYDRIHLFHFNFDNFLPVIDSKSNEEKTSTTTTKLFRKAAVLAVDSILKTVSRHSAADCTPISKTASALEIAEILQSTRQLLRDSSRVDIAKIAVRILDTVTTMTTDVVATKSHMEDPILTLILLDDNNIYRSMRYEYYQLARKHRVSFLQLFLHAPLSLAKERDASRDEDDRVGDDVIDKMAANLEDPTPEAYRWERRSCRIVVDGHEGPRSTANNRDEGIENNIRSNDLDIVKIDSSKLSDESVITDLHVSNESVITDLHVSEVEQILHRICVSALNDFVQPVPPESDLVGAEQRESDRRASLTSVLHQSDVKLRGLVSQRMKDLAREGSFKDSIKSEASKLARVKANIYDRLKSGDLELDLEGLHSELEMLFFDGLRESV